MTNEQIEQLEGVIKAMSWPQFVTLVTDLGMDVAEFSPDTTSAERLLKFENQLRAFNTVWNEVEYMLPQRRRGISRDSALACQSEIPKAAPEQAGTLGNLPTRETHGFNVTHKPFATGDSYISTTPARSPAKEAELDDTIRILHLSDLHFTESTSVDTTLQFLLDDLQHYPHLHKSKTMHYLVVSGDFTNKGSPKGLELAAQFVKELQTALNLTDAARTMLVPGNHDVVDSLQTYQRVVSKDLTEDDKKSGKWVKEGSLLLQRDEAHYPARFQPFASAFYQPVTGGLYPLEPKDQHRCASFWPDRLQFLCLNSAWEIDEFNRKRSAVHHRAVAALSKEAQRQEVVARASGALKADARLLRIGIWHHAITGPEQIQNTDFVVYFQRLGMRLALHGDVHSMTRAEYLGHSPANRVHVVGAGAFAAHAGDRPESTPCIYNILELKRDFTWLRVHTRKQDRRDLPWSSYNAWERPDGEIGALPYYDVELR